MRKHRYQVAMIGFEDEAPASKRRTRLPGAAAVRRLWAWPWQQRVALLAFVLGMSIIVMHFGG